MVYKMPNFPPDLLRPSRERTLLLLRLNVATSPPCKEKIKHKHHCTYSKDVMQKIIDNGQSLFGSTVTTLEKEIAATKMFDSHNWKIVTKIGNFSHAVRSIPYRTAKYDTGVYAMEWNVRDTTVLVFRGSFTHGDNGNIQNWILDYLSEKSTERMKQAWVDDAGLEWTKEMQARHDHHDDTWAKAALRTHQRLGTDRTFPGELEEALASSPLQASSLEGGGLTLEEARETGYWKLTKSIVDRVYAETRAGNRTLVLTGHSQGGTRAQLASMYLQHKHGAKIPTISFGATGAACVARRLFDKPASLQQQDPFPAGHDQMVEYVHPIDPWGNSMLGLDGGGKICYLGHRRSTNTTAASDRHNTHSAAMMEYCSLIYGWRGPVLLANEFSPAVAKKAELNRNFVRCRYFTHTARAMYGFLLEDLLANGTTRAGCEDVPTIARDDPSGICPTGRLTVREEEFYGFAVVLLLLPVLVPLRCCWKRRRQTRGYRAVSDDKRGDGDKIELPAIA